MRFTRLGKGMSFINIRFNKNLVYLLVVNLIFAAI